MHMQDIGSVLAQKTLDDMVPGQVRRGNVADFAGEKNPTLADAVNLASFQHVDPASAPMVRQSFSYHEQIAAFSANGSLAYAGQDGTRVFVDFSIQAVTKKVRYEMVQTVDGYAKGFEDNAHPFHESLGPRATAGRIVEFARGLLSKFRAMEGSDPEKMGAFFRKLIDAIQRGFFGLDDLLNMDSETVGDMVKETLQRVMDGMAVLGEEMGGTHKPAHRIVYEEEISYTQANVEISVVV